jgi:Methyltransferase FkbM domain
VSLTMRNWKGRIHVASSSTSSQASPASGRCGKDGRKDRIIAFLFLGLVASNFLNPYPPSAPSLSDQPSSEKCNDVRKDASGGTGIADGCYHVFLDVGANIGVHTRFLFEPEKYPKAGVARTTFDREIGTPQARDNRDLCAISFEPNPSHLARHEELRRAYSAMGWRYIPIHAGVGDQDGNLTFYHQNDEDHNEWGFSMQKFGPNSTADVVPVVQLSKFLLEQIRDRTLPADVYGNYTRGPRVVMKMDIEAMPDLIASGALCTTVDYFFGEVHGYKQFFPLTLRNNQTITQGRQHARQIFYQLLSAMDNAVNCRTQKFGSQDDEAYLFDGIPLPVPES